MAKKKLRPWPKEINIIVHYEKWWNHDFCVRFWLESAIDKASELTEKWYKCSISYSDEEWKMITVM